jgi:UDP:flavonoid glycosyltransferase YjiC (YdhE family)
MRQKRVLYVSGAIGLGHAVRDLAIARALCALRSDVEVDWLAGGAARDAIEQAGERLLPEAEHFTAGNPLVESLASGFSLNLTSPAYLVKPSGWRTFARFLRDARANVRVFAEVMARRSYDLVVGDETYELTVALARAPALKTAPFALIIDFVGVDATTSNLLERFSAALLNRAWARLLAARGPCDRILFVGELEDVDDRPFGRHLPSRREAARRSVEFIGYICGFDPAELADRAGTRARLGYGNEPLVLCAVGGTGVGAPLLELCGACLPLLRGKVPDLRMILVCGPRIRPESLVVPPGAETRGYVERLPEHFAACDVAVVQAGGTTTLELTALRRPFVYFALEGHFEQERYIAARLRRLGAGAGLRFSETTAQALAQTILAQLGTTPGYPPVATDGARRAAAVLSQLLPGP